MLAAVAVIALALGWRYSANPGKKEFERQLRALEQVRSWKLTMQISRAGMLLVSRTHEATCPDREHISETADGGFVEYIRVGDEVYYRKNDSPWIRGMPSPELFFPLPSPRPCMTDPGQPRSQPGGGAEEMRLAVYYDMKNGTIEEGDLQRLGETTCRNWKVTLLTPQNRLGSYTTCIAESDHLPRRVQSHDQNFVLQFEWDVPVSVEAPDLDVP